MIYPSKRNSVKLTFKLSQNPSSTSSYPEIQVGRNETHCRTLIITIFFVCWKFIESQVLNTIWSETSRQLAAIRESQLLLWECPWAFNVAPKLLDSCRHTFPQADIGLAGVFGYFIGTLLSVRATNGAMHAQAISPYSEKIEKAVDSGQWDAALKLARFSDVSIYRLEIMSYCKNEYGFFLDGPHTMYWK